MRRPAKEVPSTLLFAVIAMVSAVALVKTVASPFQTGSFNVGQWALFTVTVAGSTLAFVRSIRYWASISLLARVRATDSDPAADAADSTTPQRRMHPVLDDLSWGAIALVVFAINVLAAWAVVATLGNLLGDSETPTGWLLWQLALLTAASAGLLRLSGAVAAELRDRSLRRRRNAVHVITGKLLHWPGESQGASSAGRRGRQGAAVAATAALAVVAGASASGPLLEAAPDREDHMVLAERPGDSVTSGPQAAAPTGQPPAAPSNAQSARRLSRRTGTSRQSRSRGDRTEAPHAVAPAPQPNVVPAPPSTPPPATVSPGGPAPPATAQPPAPTGKHGPERKQRRRPADRRRRTTPERPEPTPPPTTPIPAPPPATPTPSPSPGTPCTPAEDAPWQPPCDPGQGTPPPG